MTKAELLELLTVERFAPGPRPLQALLVQPGVDVLPPVTAEEAERNLRILLSDDEAAAVYDMTHREAS